MKNFTLSQILLISAGFIAIAIASRLVPHPWNGTALFGVGIVASAYLGVRWGILIPIVAMLLSDLVLGFYSLPIMISVYGTFALGAFLSSWVKSKRTLDLALVSITGSALFFVVTNAAVWAFGTMYPHTLSGLMMSYVAGIPFLKSALLGDMVYTAAIASSFAYILNYREVGQRAHASLVHRTL